MPKNQAALAAMLVDVYKGEAEDFARINCQGGFSMYNPIEWVSLVIPYSLHYWDALTGYSGCFCF